MSNYDREVALAEMRAAPKRVTYACWLSGLLGIVMATRVLVLSAIPLGRAVPFAALMLFNFVFNGLSILARRRSSHAMVLVFSALPLFGSIAYSVQLLALLLTGAWRTDLRGTLLGLFGIAQTVLIIYLLRNLLSREVLHHVWKQVPRLEHRPEAQEST
jgi:hypothetical protein